MADVAAPPRHRAWLPCPSEEWSWLVPWSTALWRTNCAPPARLSHSILAAGTKRANRRAANPSDPNRPERQCPSCTRRPAEKSRCVVCRLGDYAWMTGNPDVIAPEGARSWKYQSKSQPDLNYREFDGAALCNSPRVFPDLLGESRSARIMVISFRWRTTSFNQLANHGFRA